MGRQDQTSLVKGAFNTVCWAGCSIGTGFIHRQLALPTIDEMNKTIDSKQLVLAGLATKPAISEFGVLPHLGWVSRHHCHAMGRGELPR